LELVGRKAKHQQNTREPSGSRVFWFNNPASLSGTRLRRGFVFCFGYGATVDLATSFHSPFGVPSSQKRQSD
jgi:hypothetical protein